MYVKLEHSDTKWSLRPAQEDHRLFQDDRYVWSLYNPYDYNIIPDATENGWLFIRFSPTLHVFLASQSLLQASVTIDFYFEEFPKDQVKENILKCGAKSHEMFLQLLESRKGSNPYLSNLSPSYDRKQFALLLASVGHNTPLNHG